MRERDIDNATRSSRTPGPRGYGGTKLERRVNTEKRDLMDGHRLEIANETTQLAKLQFSKINALTIRCNTATAKSTKSSFELREIPLKVHTFIPLRKVAVASNKIKENENPRNFGPS